MNRARLLALAAAIALLPSAAGAEPPLVARQIRSQGGLVRLATGVQTPRLSADAVEAARLFTALHPQALGLLGATLAQGHLTQSRQGTLVRMQARFQGLPVLGQEVVVALDHQNRVRRVASSLEPIRASVMERRLDVRAAVGRAADGLNGTLLEDGRPLGAAREVVYVKDGVARLAYEVHTASLDPMQNWYAVVDAQTGALRSRVNRVFRADAGTAGPPDTGLPCDYDAGTRTDEAKVWLPSPGADSLRPYSTVTMPHLGTLRDPSGHLLGELIAAVTCCPNVDCDPAQPAFTISGTVNYGIPIPFTTVFCDFKPRATNLLGCRTNYDYSGEEPLSIDPPDSAKAPGLGEPADFDTFAEVHAYYHANLAYDYVRQVGDPGFLLRDSDPAKTATPLPTQLWANMVMPDFNSAQISMAGVRVTAFAREDNSAFIPKEDWSALITGVDPALLPQTDAITLWQGPSADFAYDGEVVYHEFVHGVVFSTANFAGPHADAYGSLDEAGTMHEGLADFYAAAITNDSLTAEWVGARMPPAPNGEGAARDLANAKKCPDDYIGEVHYDSLPFSGALWSLRTRHQGSDQGKTFDGAVFDALASMTGASGFAEMANGVADALGTTFDAAAHDDAITEFTSRGILGCVKVLSYAQPRARFYLNGTDSGYAPYAPGHIQFKIAAPQGAEAVVVTANYSVAAHQNPMGQPTRPILHALANLDKPVTFSGPPDALTDDGAASQVFVVDATLGTVTATIPVHAAAGQVIHLAIANDFNAQEALEDVTLTLTPLAGPDAGAVDSGTGNDTPDGTAGDAATVAQDAGSSSGADAGTVKKDEGCGCASGSGSTFFVTAAALALLALGRRRRT